MTLPNFPDGVVDGDRHLYGARVYYEDTDLSGITYHANYLRWFERARSDLLLRLDIDQRAAIEGGEGAYAVTEIHLKYLRPARLDDDVLIETRCADLKAASFRMHQLAFRLTGEERELLAETQVRIGFLSPEGRPRRQPEEWRAAFARFVQQGNA